MTSPTNALEQLESFAGSAIRYGAHPSDDALVHLLVHMALSDGVLDESELAMIERIMPGHSRAEVRAWIHEVRATPLDLTALGEALDTDDRRWVALRFAARMAWRDEELAAEERQFLERAVAALGLPRGALDRVLREMTGPPLERLDVAFLEEVLQGMAWGAADFAPGGVQSLDLVPHVPADARPVARVGVDHAEVLGVYDRGLVGRFLEGAAFLPWRRIVSAARGMGLESSVRLHTDDGRIWSLVDARLGAIALLIDRLFRPDDPDPTGEAPIIQRVHTRDDED